MAERVSGAAHSTNTHHPLENGAQRVRRHSPRLSKRTPFPPRLLRSTSKRRRQRRRESRVGKRGGVSGQAAVARVVGISVTPWRTCCLPHHAHTCLPRVSPHLHAAAAAAAGNGGRQHGVNIWQHAVLSRTLFFFFFACLTSNKDGWKEGAILASALLDIWTASVNNLRTGYLLVLYGRMTLFYAAAWNIWIFLKRGRRKSARAGGWNAFWAR